MIDSTTNDPARMSITRMHTSTAEVLRRGPPIGALEVVEDEKGDMCLTYSAVDIQGFIRLYEAVCAKAYALGVEPDYRLPRGRGSYPDAIMKLDTDPDGSVALLDGA